MSLQDDISKPSEKSEKLSKLQNIICDLGSLEPSGFEAMQKSMKVKEDALEEYWDLCEADKSVAGLMQHYDLSRKDLKDVYLKMIDVGIGQWVKGHFVALSALAYREPFYYLMESEERGRWDGEDFKEVAVDILRYFREEIPQGELYKQYESGDSSFEEQEDLYPFCGYCGKKNQPSYKFCTKCGKPLDNNSEPNSKNADSILDDLVQSQEDAIPQEKEVERNDNKPTWDRFRHLVEGHFKNKLNERETIATRDFWKHYEYIYYKLNADEMAIRIETLSLLCKYPEYTIRDDQVKGGSLFFFIIGVGLIGFNLMLGIIGISIGIIFILSIKSKKQIARKFSAELILGLQGISSDKGMADLAANYIFGVVQLKGSNGSAHWPQYPSCALSGNKKLIPKNKESTVTEDSDAREKFGVEIEPTKKNKVKLVSWKPLRVVLLLITSVIFIFSWINWREFLSGIDSGNTSFGTLELFFASTLFITVIIWAVVLKLTKKFRRVIDEGNLFLSGFLGMISFLGGTSSAYLIGTQLSSGEPKQVIYGAILLSPVWFALGLLGNVLPENSNGVDRKPK
jgi:hypothetical protein